MKISYRWLQEMVPERLTPEELSERLTFLGLNVEDMHPMVDDPLEQVVMARIEAVHVLEDGLFVCWVETGDNTPIPVVSAAPNCKVGAYVPLARVGARLPGGQVIESRTFGDVQSQGMLCSASELGLRQAPSEYLLSVECASPGEPARVALGLDDLVLDLDLTPNYATHCQSMVGVARDLCASLGVDALEPLISESFDFSQGLGDFSISIEDTEGCPRYTAVCLDSVQVQASPWAIQQRLLACGVRPINNVVDLTNYVMLLWGQPIHAFDRDHIRGDAITVRSARAGERLVTLDGQERALQQTDLLITDGEGPIGIAGVMGGEHTEVTEGTQRVVLESAYFQPQRILKTARRLGLRTEAANRFEKGRDPQGTRTPLMHLVQLLDVPVSGAQDLYVAPVPARHLPFRPQRINETLGTDIPGTVMQEYLVRLGFQFKPEGPDVMLAIIPTWRADIQEEVCLAEEVARIHGYNEIPFDLPRTSVAGYVPDPLEQVTRVLRQTLVGAGFHELLTPSWLPDAWLERLGTPEDHPHRERIAVLNPMREDQSFLKSTAIPGLLDVLVRNQSHDSLRLFELSPVYLRSEMKDAWSHEPMRLALGAKGRRDSQCWGSTSDERMDYFFIKGILESLLERLHITEGEFKPTQTYYLHPRRSADLWVGGCHLATFGEMHPKARAAHEFNEPVVLCELDVEHLTKVGRLRPHFEELSEYPASIRDMALVVAESVSHAAVLQAVAAAAVDLLESVDLFDMYQGPGISSGHKSLAYRFTFRAHGRTLKEAEVEAAYQRILERLSADIGATLRS